jgi:hypothetical protein
VGPSRSAGSVESGSSQRLGDNRRYTRVIYHAIVNISRWVTESRFGYRARGNPTGARPHHSPDARAQQDTLTRRRTGSAGRPGRLLANNTAAGNTPRTTSRRRTDEQASASSCQQASHHAYGRGEAACRVGPEAVDSHGRRGRAGRPGARRAGRATSPPPREFGPEGRRLRHAEGPDRSRAPRAPAV